MEICLTASQMLEAMLPNIKPDSEKNYRLSIYNQFHTTQKGVYIYNVLTRRLAMLTQEESNLLQQKTVRGDCSDAAVLIAKRFLVAEDTDELSHYCQLYATQELFLSAADNGIEMYRILPTTGCNARCFYCFEQGVQILNMNDDTADAVIEYIKRTHHPGKKIRLEWFGGEPLLRVATIDRICRGLRIAGIDFYSTMTTNSSLFTPEVMEKAKENWLLDKVQITLDGVGEEHDRRKAYVSFPHAYERTLATIKMLVTEGIGVTVRMNMDIKNTDSIAKLYDHLRTQYSPTDRITFDPALLFDRQGDGSLREKWSALRNRIWQDGLCKMKPLENGLPRGHCLANNPTAAMILPDGMLTTCEAGREEMYYGDVRQGITKPDIKKKWLDCSQIREKCKNCPYLPECTGFALCPYEPVDCQRAMAATVAHRLAATVKKYEKN